MYALKVKKELTLDDGRLFLPGHDVGALDPFEVSDLVTRYPEHFEAADDATTAFLSNTQQVTHLADAVKRQRVEGAMKAQGTAATRKTK